MTVRSVPLKKKEQMPDSRWETIQHPLSDI